MEQLGWLQIGQHQLQQDVTHGLAFVLVDGRDNELDFANLIGVFLLDGYGIFHVGLLPERYKTMTDSLPCPVGKRNEHIHQRSWWLSLCGHSPLFLADACNA